MPGLSNAAETCFSKQRQGSDPVAHTVHPSIAREGSGGVGVWAHALYFAPFAKILQINRKTRKKYMHISGRWLAGGRVSSSRAAWVSTSCLLMAHGVVLRHQQLLIFSDLGGAPSTGHVTCTGQTTAIFSLYYSSRSACRHISNYHLQVFLLLTTCFLQKDLLKKW